MVQRIRTIKMDTINEPGATRTERKKEETKNKIVSVSLELFKKQGFDNTTMEQIAREVDIAKGTLYNYFPVKEAILADYIKQAFKEKNPGKLQRIKNLPDTRERLTQVLSELIEGVKTQKDIFLKFFVYRVQSVLTLEKVESEKSGIEQLAAEIITLGQQSGELRTDLPFEALLDLFDFVFVEIAKTFYQDPDNFLTAKVVRQYVDLFMNGAKY